MSVAPIAGGWSVRAAGTVATGTTSLTVGKPTGTVDNDIMVLVLSHKGTGFATVPAGWTLIDRDVEAVSGIRGEVYWKRAASEGSSYSVTGLANSACGCIVSYQGGLLSGDVVNTWSKGVNAAGSDTVPAITTTVPNTLVLGIGCRNASSFSSALFGVGAFIGTGFRNSDPDLHSMRRRQTGGTSAGTDSALAICDGMKIVDGSTINAFAANASGSAYVGFIVALTPETSRGAGTTYYLGSRQYQAPAREPWPLDGTWLDAFDESFRIDGGADRGIGRTFALCQNKAEAGILVNQSFACNQQGDHDVLLARFITPPLAAQTLSGTIDANLSALVRWQDNESGQTDDSHAAFKLHVYQTAGQTTTTRAVLVDNYVDPTEIARTGTGLTWVGLTAPQSVAATIQAGDSLVIELGVRIISSPTPTPTYPPTEWTRLTTCYRGATDTNQGSGFSGAGVPYRDATVGATYNTTTPALAPSFVFTDTILEQDHGTGPTNTDPETAVVATAAPYTSAVIDTTYATSNARGIWWTWTATETGTALVTAFNTLGSVEIDVYTASDPSDYDTFTEVTAVQATQECRGGHATTFFAFAATAGTHYYIRVFTVQIRSSACSAGALVTLHISYQRAPEPDDLFLPCNLLTVWRDGVLINVAADLNSVQPLGCAIDYSKRALLGLNGQMHTDYRLYVACFADNLVEILDLTTLSRQTQEVDYILDGLDLEGEISPVNLGTLTLTDGGTLYVQTFGDGFLYVVGIASGIPAYLNAPSDETDMGAMRSLPANHGDNQPNAPWPPATAVDLAEGVSGSWTGALDRDGSTFFYTNGGLYFPLGTQQTVHRYDLTTGTALADFATLTEHGTNPNVKGVTPLPDGGWLICNGDRVDRYDDAAAFVQSYVPTGWTFAPTLIYTALTADQQAFWALDLTNTTLFKFTLSTGTQTQTVETGQGPGNAIQFVIFTPQTFLYPVTGDPVLIRRLRQAPHLVDELKRVRYNMFQLDAETGIGLTSGQGIDPTIYLSWSDDAGHTWSNEYPMSLGRLGAYKTRVIWRRLGSARDRVFRVSMTDPVPIFLLDAFIELLEGTS